LVTANFTDQASNNAPSRKLSYRLTISVAPEAPVLVAVGAQEERIDLSWSAKSISDFSQYRLYRDNNSSVDESSELITIITNQNTNSYSDTDDLEPNTIYYYKLYVYDDSGLDAGSNVVNKRTVTNTAPEAVSLALEERTTDLRLTWTRNSDSDFDSYRIYRSISQISATNPDDDNLLVIDNNQGTTSFTDSGADDGVTYYYRVFVFDKYGLKAASNQVSGLIPAAE